MILKNYKKKKSPLERKINGYNKTKYSSTLCCRFIRVCPEQIVARRYILKEVKEGREKAPGSNLKPFINFIIRAYTYCHQNQVQ